MELLYKPDWPEAKKRLDAFWNGGSIGRPFVRVTARKSEKTVIPYEGTMKEKILDIDYRVRDEEETIK